MKVIDLATTKALLGLTDVATYDDQITALIPLVDSQVKLISHNNFNLQIYGKFESGSKSVDLYDIGPRCRKRINSWPTPELEQLMNDLPVGTQLEGDSIATGSHIDEVYYNGDSQPDKNIPSFLLSENATKTGDYYMYAGINIGYQRVIAKGIWWSIGQTSTGINDTAWKSRNVGPLAISRSEMDAATDGKYGGMPAWFIKGLPRYHR